MSQTIKYGIDLGTTNSAVATIENGNPRIIKNTTFQTDTTPSAVMIDKSLGVIVGSKAYQASANEGKVRMEFKRLMGTSQKLNFKDANVTKTPEDLSAEVLKELLRSVQASKGEAVTAAVITIPAAFESVQCSATLKAAELAGITDCHLLQEPIAASVAYGFTKQSGDEERWLVYDFGGGTFDVAIMEKKDNQLSVIDHAGDNYLGGKDFDNLLIHNIILPHLREAFHLYSEEHPKYRTLLGRLRLRAETAKIELSTQDSTSLDFSDLGEDLSGNEFDGSLSLSRRQYNQLIRPLIDRSIGLCEQALKQAHLTPKDLSKVILVGGPTFTPAIREALEGAFGKIVDYSIDPMTAVAQGAAIFAQTLFVKEKKVSAPTRDAVELRVGYEAVSGSSEEIVSLKLSIANAGLEVQLERQDGGFITGRKSLDGIAQFTVPLQQKTQNTFVIRLYDSRGELISSSPSSLSILQGLAVANPPLPHSIGVQAESEELDLAGEVVHVMLTKGRSLPAVATQTFRTTKEVRKGTEDAIRIRVYEGEQKIADRNRWLGRLKIDGMSINRTIPRNTDVEVTLEIDTSRIVSSSAYIPLLDQTFDKIISKLRSEEISANDLQERVKKVKHELASLEHERSLDESVRLEVLRLRESEEVSELNTLHSHARNGDADSTEKLSRRLQDIQGKVDTLRDTLEEPRLREELLSEVKSLSALLEVTSSQEHVPHATRLKDWSAQILANMPFDKSSARQCIEEISDFHFRIASEHTEFWVAQLSYLVEGHARGEVKFNDPAMVAGLITKGKAVLAAGPAESAREIVCDLWSALPGGESTSLAERARSGLRAG